MARSKWKFTFFSKKIVQKNFAIFCLKAFEKIILKSRKNSIPKFFKNKVVFIHKGLVWSKIYVTNFHIGRKLGEFGLTKKPFYYPIKDKTSTKLSKR